MVNYAFNFSKENIIWSIFNINYGIINVIIAVYGYHIDNGGLCITSSYYILCNVMQRNAYTAKTR